MKNKIKQNIRKKSSETTFGIRVAFYWCVRVHLDLSRATDCALNMLIFSYLAFFQIDCAWLLLLSRENKFKN